MKVHPAVRCLVAALVLVSIPLMAGEVSDDWIEQVVFGLEDMKGQERRDTILKACELSDKRLVEPLAKALLDAHEEDTDELKELVTAALCRMVDASAMETVTALCESEDLEAKVRGLKVMGHIRTREAIEFLQQRVHMSFGSEKEAAIQALGYSGEKRLVPFLTRLLKKGAPDEQTAARMALARLGVNDVVPALLQDYERNHRAREKLDFEMKRAMRMPDGREKSRTIKRIKDKQKRVFRMLREQRQFFLEIPPTAIPVFVKAANEDALAFSLSLILENLPRMASKETAPLFVGLLNNQHYLIRLRALAILEKYRAPETGKQVREILTAQLGSTHWRLRLFALESSYWLPDESRAPLALKCLEDPSRAVRLEAIRQLGQQRLAAASPKLREILDGANDVGLAMACRDAIGEIEGR